MDGTNSLKINQMHFEFLGIELHVLTKLDLDTCTYLVIHLMSFIINVL